MSLFFRFLLLSLAILKYRHYFLMLQTLKLNNDKQKNSLFYKEKKFGRIDSRSLLTERKIPHNNNKNLNFEIRDDAEHISLKFHLQMKGKIEFNSHEKNTILVKCFEFANV
jgi:hypothetical protein